jgi:polyhydroxyalkanoate synthase subunit PhaC
LPLFLELVRQVSHQDPALARRALAGLDAYENAPSAAEPPSRPAVAQVDSAALRDHGGDGPPIILIPSLINPPDVLDLDEETSLAGALAAAGHRVLLVDWGQASARAGLSVAGHVETLLLPLLDALGEPATIVGYCLGGTMAIAAARLSPVRRLVTLAAPWHFSRYPAESRAALGQLWDRSQASSRQLGALPMEVMQAGFWALDPERTVRKFADFSQLDPSGQQARRFIVLEDWANQGEPLPLPAASELFESFYRDDAPGSGAWRVGGATIAENSSTPTLHVVAGEDRIVPPATAPQGNQLVIDAGHVGMIVGRARFKLHKAMARFIAD